MAITIICPNLICRSVLQVPDTMRGQKVRCARCGRNFRVPEPTATKGSQQKAPAETKDAAPK